MQKIRDLEQKCINTIRFLSADGVQKAESGHPGLPMGTAPMAFTLWAKHLNHNPKNPQWANRDRFILSGGHGSMLLYSLLHLTGYDLSLDELKNFRQWGSLTPGHPEFGLTPGVETTTGPLGQGFANGVGMAMAEVHLAAVFNRPDYEIINHYTYAIVTDGDLMEGVASEAASLAGTLKLGKLIYLYDDNAITIEGSTDIAFSEDTKMRFNSYGWQVQQVDNGLDVEAIDQAIQNAKADPRPSIIFVRNIIGYGLPTRAGKPSAHGEPPGIGEITGAKENLAWPTEPDFYIPEEVLSYFRQAVKVGAENEVGWNQQYADYKKAYPELAAELTRRLNGELPDNWQNSLPEFAADEKGLATRASSGKALNALAKALPELFGGSADLAPSTKTWMDNSYAFFPTDISGKGDSYAGRNVHFGVRENGMGSIVNGLAYHGGFIPFGSTFMVFSDYMRPAIRLSALSHLGSIWIFTHDSIGVGEDGPTHQPVEHLSALRCIPNLLTFRPADANEVSEAWKVAIENRHRPSALVLSRQNLLTIDRSIYAQASGTQKGAYVLADLGNDQPEIILMATGSEVDLIIKAGHALADKGKKVRLVSFPCWELFQEQDQDYQDSVLLPEVTARLAVEAGVSQGWHRWVGTKGKIIAIDHFGASGPAAIVFEKFGFTASNVEKTALSLLAE